VDKVLVALVAVAAVLVMAACTAPMVVKSIGPVDPVSESAAVVCWDGTNGSEKVVPWDVLGAVAPSVGSEWLC
jgi:hypothetical protein